MFKFLEKKNDEIQQDVNSAVDCGVTEVKDIIDAHITEIAYNKVAEIMEEHELSDNDENIHDELFCEIVDTIYSELGIY